MTPTMLLAGTKQADDGVMVVSFRKDRAWWWDSGRVGIIYPLANAEPIKGVPPPSITGAVHLNFNADRADSYDLTPLHRLALAVLRGDVQSGRVLADMVLQGETR